MNSILNHKIGHTVVAALAVVAMMTAGPAFAGSKKKTKVRRPAATKKVDKAATADKKTPVAAPPAPAIAVPVVAEAISAPTDSDILEAETVAVQPVLGVGAGANVAWYNLANYAAVAKVDQSEAKAALAAGIVMPKAAEKGFGFAGASDAKDMRVLHYGISLSYLFVRMSLRDVAKSKDAAELLKKSASLLADLSPEARGAAMDLVLGASQGKRTAASGKFFLAEALKAGMRGVAAGPQRAHGYYMAGIWAGGALLYASIGGNETYADMAEPIAIMLDKDASFGGSDREIAKHLRVIAKELKAKKPSARAVGLEILAIQKIGADTK